MRPVVALILAAALVQRAFELARSLAHRRRLGPRARDVRPDGMVAIVLVHAAALGGIALEDTLLGPTIESRAVRLAAAAAWGAAALVRAWAMRALGSRWNLRVVVTGEPPVRSGPYRFLRHPNYAAAALELVAMPLAAGLVWTPALVLPLKLGALARRIAIEDRALRGER